MTDMRLCRRDQPGDASGLHQRFRPVFFARYKKASAALISMAGVTSSVLGRQVVMPALAVTRPNGWSLCSMFSALMDSRISCAILPAPALWVSGSRSEEHTSELQSLMRISYAVFCLKKKTALNHYY